MKFIIENVTGKDFTDKKIKKEKIIYKGITHNVNTIKINSLEELMNFQIKCEYPIILETIDPDFPESIPPRIIIYDGYIE